MAGLRAGLPVAFKALGPLTTADAAGLECRESPVLGDGPVG